MQIILETSGGFAGGIRHPAQVVETDGLPPAARAEVQGLVDQACAAAAEAAQAERSVPDGMSYRITVHTEIPAVVLSGCDGVMSPAFRALLDWVRRHAR
jgi:hypothetical protein